MDWTIKYCPEWGNPITKEYTRYALTDKWVLSQNLILPKIQFTDHMKLKKKEEQSMDDSVLLKMRNKILKGGSTETKCGVEIEGKAIQRLPHLGIHPIYRHQTQTLLQMPWSAWWQEPDTAVSREALPEPDKYRGRYLQPTIGLSMGPPIEVLKTELKELKEFATHRKKNNINQPDSLEFLGTKPPTKNTHAGTHASNCICSRGRLFGH